MSVNQPEQQSQLPFNAAKPLFLLSADTPACGMSTLASGLEHALDGVHVVRMGNEVRSQVGAVSEAGLSERSGLIPDPLAFDARYYQDLPEDMFGVVEGKLATTIAPRLTMLGDRALVLVDLTSDPFVSAKRVTERELGGRFSWLTAFGRGGEEAVERLLQNHVFVNQRKDRDAEMRRKVIESYPTEIGRVASRHTYNTTLFSPDEIVMRLLETGNPRDEVFEWELDAVADTLDDMTIVGGRFRERLKDADKRQHEHSREAVEYELQRLALHKTPDAIAKIRSGLRDAIVDSWASLVMKGSPRFYQDADGVISLDVTSSRWSPEFYKIANAWPVLSNLLKGKEILDPFAGPGTLTNMLAGRNIPKKIHVSDIAYQNGEPLDDEGHLYVPEMNRMMWTSFFDRLPSWYRPNTTPVEEPKTADARRLPFDDKSIDYIVTDPPYDKNHAGGGVSLLLEVLPEFARVSKLGSVMLLPVGWVQELKKRVPYGITQITGDLSAGRSNYPTCYVLIGADRIK